MRKNMKEYKDHFEEEPWIYNKIDYVYERWLDKLGGIEKSQELSELERKIKDIFYF